MPGNWQTVGFKKAEILLLSHRRVGINASQAFPGENPTTMALDAAECMFILSLSVNNRR